MNRARILASNSRPCARCNDRYAQAHSPHCRRCARELGDTSTLFERERINVARQKARYRGGKIPDEDLAPRPDVERTINGVTYVIVWDGA